MGILSLAPRKVRRTVRGNGGREGHGAFRALEKAPHEGDGRKARGLSTAVEPFYMILNFIQEGGVSLCAWIP